MASTTAFASLSVPVLDDSMELTSSPGGNQADNDIDLDLDDYGVVQLTDDERMMEDPRPGTANDDMMEDAEQMVGTPVVEEMMHDDIVTYDHDEELIDYSDDEYQEDIPLVNEVDTTQDTEGSVLAPIEAVNEPEQVDEEIVRQPDPVIEETLVQTLLADDVPTLTDDVPTANENHEQDPEPPTDEVREAIDDATSDAVPAFEVSAEEIADLEQATTLVSESADLSGATATAVVENGEEVLPEDDQHHDGDDEVEAAEKQPSTLDTSADFALEGPSTPSDTGIHPITVRYGDFVMPLFKSRAQPEGLLKDDNLASLSVSNLLVNCRQRLESKIGESISTDQDLVLSFENMGLIVSENSPYAFQSSLSEILEIFLQLHQNDGTSVIPPLALSLTLQLKFTSSFNLLKMAAQQGQGMSSFSLLQTDEENEAYYEDEEEEGAYAEDNNQEYAAGENENFEGERPAQAFVHEEAPQQVQEGQEYDEEHEGEYEEEHDYEGQDWDEYQQDGISGTFDEGQNLDENVDHEQTTQDAYDDTNEENQDGTDNTLPPALDGSSAIDPVDSNDRAGEEANIANGETEQEAGGFVESESAASSATVRNAATNDAIGEYNLEGDLIDYEDDDLSIWPKEHQADYEEDELEALAGGLEEAENAANANDSVEHDAQTSEVFDPPVGDEHTSDFEARNDANHPQEELIDYPDDEEEVKSGNEADGSADHPAAGGDNDAEQQDQNGEEEGQFHAAFNLLEDNELEHAPGEAVTTNDYSADYDEDHIDFDEDDDVVKPQAAASTRTSNSPLGKRSFDEHDQSNGTSAQPTPKKARAG